MKNIGNKHNMQSTLNSDGVFCLRLLIILGLLEINGLPRAEQLFLFDSSQGGDDFALDACSGKFMDLKISSQ